MDNSTSKAQERLLEKLRKVAALANDNPNQHEAEVAAAKLQELLILHNLELADILKTDPKSASSIISIQMELSETYSSITWKLALWSTVAQYSFCKVFTINRSNRILLVGRDTDIQAVITSVNYLMPMIQKIARTIYTPSKYKYVGRNAWFRSFLEGAVQGIGITLSEQWEQTHRVASEMNALVVRTDQEITDFITEKFGKPQPKVSNRGSQTHAAHSAGYTAGRNLNPKAPKELAD